MEITLIFKTLSTKVIHICIENKVIGTMIDTCCSSILSFDGITQVLTFKNQSGGGGFLEKGYYNQFHEVWLYVYQSESLKKYLMKNQISIPKEKLKDSSYFEIIKSYENIT